MSRSSTRTLMRIVSIVLCFSMMLTVSAAMPGSEQFAGSTFISEEMDTVTGQVGNEAMKEAGRKLEKGGNAAAACTSPDDAKGNRYYVSVTDGNDANDGLSAASPWKSIERVNQAFKNKDILPGDELLFKAGDVWQWVRGVNTEPLTITVSGTEESPIVIGSYGTGNKPYFKGDFSRGKATGTKSISTTSGQNILTQYQYGEIVNELILIKNAEHIEIRDIEISNAVEGFTGTYNAENGSRIDGMDLRGIHIVADPAAEEKVYSGYHIHDMYIHDVTGELYWISNSGKVAPGVTYGGGWEKSKRTGAILFEISTPDTDGQPATFRDVTIEDSFFIDNSFGSVILKQYCGPDRSHTIWGGRDKASKTGYPSYDDANWHPHENVVIQNNYLNHRGTGYGCDTIYVTSVRDGIIQHNVSEGSGTSAIEMYYTDNIVVQYNEVADTVVKAGGADSNGIDSDKESTNTLIQYNYLHGCGDGILLCGFTFGSAVVRSNVIYNCSKRYINPHGDKGHNYIYNNVLIHTSDSRAPFFESSGGNSTYLEKSGSSYNLYNNIFYTSQKVEAGIGTGSDTDFDKNLYCGFDSKYIPSQDAHAVKGDPLFKSFSDFAAKSSGVDALPYLKLRQDSPAVDAGKKISGIHSNTTNINEPTTESVDMLGVLCADGKPDIGAMEYAAPQDTASGSISGFVSDPLGQGIADVAVTLLSGTENIARIVTDDNGSFSIRGLTPATYSLRLSKNGYEECTITNITVKQSTDTDISCSIREAAPYACFSGVVRNISGYIADAAVTLTRVRDKDGGDVTEAAIIRKTDANGAFSFNDLNAGKGPDAGTYAVKVEKDGFHALEYSDYVLLSGAEREETFVLTKQDGTADYFFIEDFEDYATGTFTGTTTAGKSRWKVFGTSGSNNTVTIKKDSQTGLRYLCLLKDGSKSADMGIYNATNLNVSGVFVLEARIKRTQDSASANQFGMYSFNSSDFLTSTPAKSGNPIATFYMRKNIGIGTHEYPKAEVSAIKPYQLDRWYTVRLVINTDTGKYDFYVDDMSIPVLEQKQLRTAKKDIDRLMIYASTSNYGDLMVDYIRLNYGEPMERSLAELASLKAFSGNNEVALTPASGNTFTGEVASTVEALDIHAIPASIFAKAKVSYVNKDGIDQSEASFAYTSNGKKLTLQKSITIPLHTGENAIRVTCIAEDGSEKTYMLSINKEEALQPEPEPETPTEPEEDEETIEYIFFEDFEDYATGTFTGTTTAGKSRWKVFGTSGSNNTVTIKKDSQTGLRYLCLSKNGEKSADMGIYNTSNLNASGVFVLEARIKRTQDSTSANQFGMYSFNSSDFLTSTPAKSGNPIATFYMRKNVGIGTHEYPKAEVSAIKPYQLDRWYTVRLVINTITGKYDFYVDDMTTPVLEQKQLRTAKKDIDRLLIYAGTSNYGDLMVDYIWLGCVQTGN